MGEMDKEGNAPESGTEGAGGAPAAHESTELRAKELATTLACTMDIVALFAAPRVLARTVSEARRLPVRDEISKTIEGCMKALGADEMPIVEPLRALQALLVSWEPGEPAPQSIVEAARAWLRSVGLPEPDEGWDRWEGPSDAPEPAPARPTPRILRVEPMAIEEWAKLDGPGELVDGMLVEEKMTAPPHDAVVAWLLNELRAWASPRGAVVLGPGHKLVVSKLGGRKPDICVYAADNPPKGDATLSSRPPALVVEVSSPRKVDMRTDFITKQREYACRGVRRYWRVEPTQRFLEGLELEPGERYGRYLGVTGGMLLDVGLAGLELDLDDLWAKVDSHLAGARGETL